jgi:uncharacterized Zn finger protein (UPF0148 family)
LVKGKVGTVKCPNCQRRIYTSTKWMESREQIFDT